MARKNNGKMVCDIVLSVGGAFLLIPLLVFGLIINPPTEYKTQYRCNYNLVDFALNVDVKGTNNSEYKISGEFFSAFVDNLEMKNSTGKVVRTSKDEFNFISQNNHTIMNGNTVKYICDGKINILADSYDVYDANGTKVAYVAFDIFDTVGSMVDMNGKEIARYDSALFRHDYTVTTFDGCDIDDESVVMIFASYVSDKRADNRSKSSHSD